VLPRLRATNRLSPHALRNILAVDPAFANVGKTKLYEEFLAELRPSPAASLP
jgi:hypothetical protein